MVLSGEYETANPKLWLKFSHSWQGRIHPVLAGRLAYLASVKNKILPITSGFRSNEEQINAQKNALADNPAYYQTADGGVWKPAKGGKDQRMVAPAGSSSHNWGLAIDSSGTWLSAMTNTELKRVGLRKPMSYENWHVEPIETAGMTLAEKKIEFYEYMNGGHYPMDIKTLQMITGLLPDGVIGKQTINKVQEILECISEVFESDTYKGNTIMVDNKKLEAKTIACGGSTFVPVRSIAEALGKKVNWDAGTKTVTIV